MYLGKNDQEKFEKRLEQLQQYLAENYGIEDDIRDDSRLAFGWANQSIDLPLEKVAHEIALMDSLFRTTDYKFVSETVVDRIVDDLTKRFGLTHEEALIITTKTIIPALKYRYIHTELVDRFPHERETDVHENRT
jgi:hypothetical protein